MYQFTSNKDFVKRIADGAMIPLSDPDGAAQRAYTEWVAQGNTPAAVADAEWRAPILADFKAMREIYINRIVGICWASGDATVQAAGLTLRQGLLDLPADASITGAATPTALRQAITARYQALVTPLPAAAKVAFSKVTA